MKQYIKNYIKYIGFIIYVMIFVVIIHEMGHTISALILGHTPSIITIDFNKLQCICYIEFNHEPTKIEIMIIASSGSLFTFLIGIILLELNFKYNKFNEKLYLILYTKGLVAVWDIVLYIPYDILIGKKGDWNLVYNEFPLFVLLIFLFTSVYSILAFTTLNKRLVNVYFI